MRLTSGRREIFVNSSAAGGLRMSVHGLTRSMTARAAREAALGAGAIVTMTTVGAMDEFDLEDLHENRPNIILLAGGVDDGEKRIVVENAEVIASAQLGVPVVYAGNSRARRRVEHIFADAGQPLTCVDNVFLTSTCCVSNRCALSFMTSSTITSPLPQACTA